ncbi:MAG: hypothetical protein ACKPKO_41505, partial [Candidatus Fonsibacter sp.]
TDISFCMDCNKIALGGGSPSCHDFPVQPALGGRYGRILQIDTVSIAETPEFANALSEVIIQYRVSTSGGWRKGPPYVLSVAPHHCFRVGVYDYIVPVLIMER